MKTWGKILTQRRGFEIGASSKGWSCKTGTILFGIVRDAKLGFKFTHFIVGWFVFTWACVDTPIIINVGDKKK